MASVEVCKTEGCDKRVEARGLCKKHYMRWLRSSASIGVKKIFDGRYKHPLWRVYWNMIGRCYSESRPDYRLYGGRGIKVCERWRNDFLAFVADMGPRPSPKHSVDRWPNQNGDYEPSNCRWATQTEQCRNSRKNRIITINDRSQTMSEWAEESGLGAAFRRRLYLGWSPEEAIQRPKRK